MFSNNKTHFSNSCTKHPSDFVWLIWVLVFHCFVSFNFLNFFFSRYYSEKQNGCRNGGNTYYIMSFVFLRKILCHLLVVVSCLVHRNLKMSKRVLACSGKCLPAIFWHDRISIFFNETIFLKQFLSISYFISH